MGIERVGSGRFPPDLCSGVAGAIRGCESCAFARVSLRMGVHSIGGALDGGAGRDHRCLSLLAGCGVLCLPWSAGRSRANAEIHARHRLGNLHCWDYPAIYVARQCVLAFPVRIRPPRNRTVRLTEQLRCVRGIARSHRADSTWCIGLVGGCRTCRHRRRQRIACGSDSRSGRDSRDFGPATSGTRFCARWRACCCVRGSGGIPIPLGSISAIRSVRGSP